MRAYTIILYLVLPGLLSAQSFDWASMAGGPGSDQAYAIATDAAGNSYVTGWFSETVHFGDVVLNSEGGKDVFIAKYDASGEVMWAKRAWGVASNTAAGICLDWDGFPIITGWFAESIHFGETTLESRGSYDMFVARYHADGEVVWAKSAGGEGDDYGNRVTTNMESDVLVSGSFKYTAHFGEETTITSAGDRDIFIANYSNTGNFHWVKEAGGMGEDRAYDIVSDGEGYTYYTGVFTGKAFFGEHHIQSSSFLSSYIAKMDAAGNTLWVKKGTGGANDFSRGYGIGLDSEGSVIGCGTFSGRITYGEHSLEASGGEYDFDTYMVKLNHEGGVQYLVKGGGYGMDQAMDLVTDQHGYAYMTGFFSGEVHFGNLVLESFGKSDICIVKYNWAGEALWAKRAGGHFLDYGYGISNDTLGALYVCGNFQEGASFDDHSIEGVGGMDMFIAKLLHTGDFIPEHGGGTLFISPNPNNGRFELAIPKNKNSLTLTIYDMQGKKVMEKQLEGQNENINLSLELPLGTYILTIPENQSSQKLIIQ